ncbi:MAG TPA: FKBP-type peptidyl-prolyl cis-trans isomerase [Thermoanaerobaculia bacterium]|nr:FKBP-type peptidyl-prolyl cis-trans isomerase [Thermoanaerobaculia bacterium]
MPRWILAVLALALLVVMPACAAEPETATAAPDEASLQLETDEQKTLYTLGFALGQNLQSFSLTADEVRYVLQGIEDHALGQEPRIDVESVWPQVQALAQRRAESTANAEKQAGSDFVAAMVAEEGAEKTESGLVFRSLQEGAGDSPGPTDTVRVHYHGTLRDGEVFDSSVERGTPATFPLDRVIPCWTEVLQRMKEGGKAKVTCPPELAYGDRGQGKILPGSTLVFEVELLEVVDSEGAAAPPQQ